MHIHQPAVVGLLSLLGCGDPQEEEDDMLCQQTCARLYDDSQCGIARPGVTQDELMGICEEECLQAMAIEGELGDYEPHSSGAATSVTLDNRAQAEAWADCMDETSCDDLYAGYCAPVW